MLTLIEAVVVVGPVALFSWLAWRSTGAKRRRWCWAALGYLLLLLLFLLVAVTLAH